MRDFNALFNGASDAAHVVAGRDKHIGQHIGHEEVILRYHDGGHPAWSFILMTGGCTGHFGQRAGVRLGRRPTGRDTSVGSGWSLCLEPLYT
jgi:hypothetical protein